MYLLTNRKESIQRIYRIWSSTTLRLFVHLRPFVSYHSLLCRAYLETKQAQPAAVKGMVTVDQHVEAFNFVEKALAILEEVTQSVPC